MLLVGWGEGMEQAAAYLNTKVNASELHIATWYQSPLDPFFQGTTSLLYQADYSTDYFVFYINEAQRNPSRAQHYCPPQGPEKVVHANGIDYAWICSNDRTRQPLIEYLERHAVSRDVILLSKRAPRLAARLPGEVLVARDDVLATLHGLEQATERLWYVREPYAIEHPRMLDRQLSACCRKLGEIQLPLAYVISYQLPPVEVPSSD